MHPVSGPVFTSWTENAGFPEGELNNRAESRAPTRPVMRTCKPGAPPGTGACSSWQSRVPLPPSSQHLPLGTQKDPKRTRKATQAKLIYAFSNVAPPSRDVRRRPTAHTGNTDARRPTHSPWSKTRVPTARRRKCVSLLHGGRTPEEDVARDRALESTPVQLAKPTIQKASETERLSSEKERQGNVLILAHVCGAE